MSKKIFLLRIFFFFLNESTVLYCLNVYCLAGLFHAIGDDRNIVSRFVAGKKIQI